MTATTVTGRLCLVLVCGLAAGCARPPGGPERTDASTRFEENKSLFAAIRDADQVSLYEGLPHQMFEPSQLEKEKQTKQTVQIHGYPFYREVLAIEAQDREPLKKLLGNVESFRQWRGEKLCGGLHPDYLVEYRAGNKEYRLLLCFGCSEVKVYGPHDSLRCDIAGDAEKQLEELLKKYRKNRPEFRFGG